MKKTRSLLTIASLVALQMQTAVAQSTLTPTRADRGQAKYFFSIPGTDRKEACIVPRFLPGVEYPKKALETLTELCSYTFYPIENEQQEQMVACQKLNSTNPGLNLYDISKAVKAGKKVTCANVDILDDQDLLKKLGKYKQSTSCSYAPGILAYYHVSQALGKVVRVPESVMRTVDTKFHVGIGNDAMDSLTYLKANDPKLFNAHSIIYLTLGSLLSNLKNPAASSKKPLLFTDSLQESYGALLVNPRGEEVYSAMFMRPDDSDKKAANDQQNLARAYAFAARQPDFQNLKNSASLSSISSLRPTIENAGKLIAMRDVADMVVIDSLMSQEDRFGNIHYQPFKAMIVDQNGERSLELVKAKDYDEKFVKNMEANGYQILGSSDVKQMILKDNDCSVSRENIQTRAKLIESVNHIDPKTYQGLLKFNQSLSDAATKAVFRVDFFFTETDYAKLQKSAAYVTGVLQNKCRTGQLKLDLDVEHYLTTGTVKPQTAADCELN